MHEQIIEAVKVLKQGGIIIFPTDTAFGIGCRIENEEAVQRVFEIRNRPETKATPVLVSSYEMAKNYWQSVSTEIKEKLIDRYWPGALTIVLHCQTKKIPSLVRGGRDTLGMRMPNNTTMLEIIKQLGVPMLGPSANFAGEKTPYAVTEIDKDLIKQVDYVVNGECTIKQISTVIDCTQKPWKILRAGGVTIKNDQEKKEKAV